MLGIDGIGVNVEVDIASGLPQTIIVGLPDSTIRESVERVRTAIKNVGHRFPMERITINLSPADVKKEGTGFDLAIAVAILISSKQLQPIPLQQTLIVGELALSGEIKRVRGLLAILEFAKNNHFTHIIIPKENEEEAALVSNLMIAPIAHLNELSQLIFTESDKLSQSQITSEVPYNYGDITDINGQQSAKRALLIAAAGKHNMALMGPPGVGKTMLLRRLPSLLPPLTEAESLQVTKINSLVTNHLTNHLVNIPPFRQPHHTISAAGLIGGGNPAKPGEISLSHLGVLFLDEFTEYPRHIIELLRQPLEERQVSISRARANYKFPAHFILAVSFNPCPCGLFGYDKIDQQCKCSTTSIQKYRAKLSGPILDRIDLQIALNRPTIQSSASNAINEPNSLQLQQKVIHARQYQLQRNEQFGFRFNSDLEGKNLKSICMVSKEAEQLLHAAYEQLNFSYRGYDKVIKIARTIADLEQHEVIETEHISEAISYRNGDLTMTL